MEVMETISIIKELVCCMKDGVEIISRMNEHYEKKRVKTQRKERDYSSYQCNVMNIRTGETVPGHSVNCNGILLFMTDELYDLEIHSNPAFQNRGIKINFFKDKKRLNQFSEVMLEHSKESVVVVRSDYRNKKLALQLDMLNIVPGNDDLCYRILCKEKRKFANKNYKKAVNEHLGDVIEALVQVYERYQKSVAESRARLELESRILANLGYTNIAYRPVTLGYGLEIPLKEKKIMVGIPYGYPRKAPMVVVLDNNSYRNIKFDGNWEPFMTIGHIMTAIEKGME